MKNLLNASLMASLSMVQPEKGTVSEPQKNIQMMAGCVGSCQARCENSCYNGCGSGCQGAMVF